MKKSKFPLCAMILIIFACQNAEARLGELNEQFSDAFVLRDHEQLLKVASAIDSDDIRGADGRAYFELKLRALTFAGE